MRPTSPNVGRPFAAEINNTRGAAKVEKTPAANSVRRAAPRKEALAMRLRQKELHRKTKDRGHIAALVRYPRPSSAPNPINTSQLPWPRHMRNNSAAARYTRTATQRSGVTQFGPSQK